MTAAVRARSPSPAEASSSKKARIESTESKGIQVPSAEQLQQYRQSYVDATPYRHAVIPGLLSDELLEGVVEESRTYGIRGEEGSLQGWGWEQKETDIYKIQQTPDLSSLDPEHLPEETLQALPCITKLRNALYAKEFRELVQKVTGCGPLSGKKTDGSVGLYTQGSHLLLHDDSISSRLISFILYLPNSPTDAPPASVPLEPSANGKFSKGWVPEWGGALELFPVEDGKDTGLPGVKASWRVDVKWGQIVFFEVQPGRSYHSVEEVIVGDGRQRLGVSGWFHRPVEGEEGYEPEDATLKQKNLSSLAQITSTPTIPLTPYTSNPPTGLTSAHLSALSPFLAPSYLSASTLERLSQQFAAASEIVLHNFLHPDLASKVKAETEKADKDDYASVSGLPPQDLGETDGWTLQGPSSKHRYAALTGESSRTPAVQRVLKELIPSEAFRAWLSVVSSLAPIGYRAEARRLRRGLDYTLAAGEEKTGDARLDVCLGMSWWADVPAGSDEEDALVDHGGWDCYLAAPDEDEDPAVFQSALAKKANGNQQEPDDKSDEGEENGEDNNEEGSATKGGPVELEIDPDQLSPSDFDSDSDDEDDGPLLTQAVSFNKLMLVLRDPGVMKFTKYLSAAAPGSRWDVGGEWEVGVLEEEEEEGEDNDKEDA